MLIATILNVSILLVEGYNSYGPREGKAVVERALKRVERETGTKLNVVDVTSFSALRIYDSSPEELYEQNRAYFPLARADRITVVLAPPTKRGYAGVASGICTPGIAVVNAPNDLGFAKLRRESGRRVVHEVLHLLGVTHDAGGLMGGGRGITATARAQVRSCLK